MTKRGSTPLVPEVRAAALSVPSGFVSMAEDGLAGRPACEYCYSRTLSDFLLADIPSEDIIEACLGTDGPTEHCLRSTSMINIREVFLQCAGYDVLMTGNTCSAAAVGAVESPIPAPYYTFAQCAYHRETPFCSTTQAYLDQIEADTDSADCLACYTELQSDLLALAGDDTEGVCGEEVFSKECIACHTSALSAFELCSGFTLNTVSSTRHPQQYRDTDC